MKKKYKICSKCNTKKLFKEFPKLYSTKKDGSPISDGRRANCRVCENKRRKRLYDEKPVRRMIMNAKARAKAQNLEFTLVEEDIVIPKYCPILEVKLTLGTKSNYEFSPSIDRINSEKGYTKDNIKVVSLLANRMKSNATKEQCFLFSKNILNYFN